MSNRIGVTFSRGSILCAGPAIQSGGVPRHDGHTDRAGRRARGGRPAGASDREEQRRDGPGDDSHPVSRLAEWSRDRSDRPRRVLFCVRAVLVSATGSACAPSVRRSFDASRVSCLENGGSPEVWLGSADLMERNLDRRVEVLCPVREPSLVHHLREVVLDASARRRSRVPS